MTVAKPDLATDSRSRDNGYPLSRNLNVEPFSLANFKSLGRATRKHSPQQIGKLAKSLQQFGFVLPIVIDGSGRVIAGWGLVLAGRKLGLSEAPAVKIQDLSEGELRALRLALNRIAEDASWDGQELARELSELLDLGNIELQTTGFEIGEVDHLLYGDGSDQEDELPSIEDRGQPVSCPGDLWQAGEHLIYCGDALLADSYTRLLPNDKAQSVVTDPPYNVAMKGHASGLGKVKHKNFIMASGEFSSAEFTNFLRTSLGLAAANSVNGAVHFVCMDWRHIREILAAGDQIYSQLLNLCVWNKSNAGMGSLYRSKHELVFVFKVGKASHINNVALGRYGRNRTNVWDYLGQNSLNGTSKSKLSLHPTVKPVAMVADAICDCSDRNGLILDPFVGAGTTLIAAERTGRRARLIELDPMYVDVSVQRWQRLTGETATHAETGRPFGPR